MARSGTYQYTVLHLMHLMMIDDAPDARYNGGVPTGIFEYLLRPLAQGALFAKWKLTLTKLKVQPDGQCHGNGLGTHSMPYEQAQLFF